MNEWHDIVEQMIETANSFVEKHGLFDERDLLDLLGDLEKDAPTQIKEARIQKAMMTDIKSRLDKDIAFNQEFKDKTDWNWLNRMLTAARVKELASVRIVVKGRRSGMGFDITELVRSYYGRQILKGLDFNVSRRRVATREEFETIQEACARIKLKLPEVIQPTTTEQFFET